MVILADVLVRHEEHGRKDADRGQEADQDPLAHDQADVSPQAQLHEDQDDKARKGRKGRGEDGGDGVFDGPGHGLLGGLPLLLFFHISSVEEDGIVHGDRQLEGGGDGLSDVGNLAQEEVGPEVVGHGVADGQDEDKGDDGRLIGQGEDNDSQNHREQNINGCFFVDDVLGVLDQGGDPAQVFGGGIQLADLFNGRHGRHGGGGVLELHDHEGGPVRIKRIPEFVGQHVLGDHLADQGGLGDDVLHAFNLQDFFAEGLGLPVIPFHNEHACRGVIELLIQDLLSLG